MSHAAVFLLGVLCALGGMAIAVVVVIDAARTRR